MTLQSDISTGDPGMIYVRLVHGVVDHFHARLNEWIMAFPLIGFAFVLSRDPYLFENAGSFSELARWASEGTWALICTVAALGRLAALVVNGTFHSFRYAPHLRLVASLIAAAFWMRIAFSTIWSMLDGSGGVGTAVVMYTTATLLESANIYRTSRDRALESAGHKRARESE